MVLGTKDLSQGLNPLFTTHPKNPPITPFLATLPKSLDLKSFICHTCDTPPGAAGVLLTRHATRHVYPERPSEVKGLPCSPMKDFYRERPSGVPFYLVHLPTNRLRRGDGTMNRTASGQERRNAQDRPLQMPRGHDESCPAGLIPTRRVRRGAGVVGLRREVGRAPTGSGKSKLENRNWKSGKE